MYSFIVQYNVVHGDEESAEETKSRSSDRL
jgi:hypothetical protein